MKLICAEIMIHRFDGAGIYCGTTPVAASVQVPDDLLVDTIAQRVALELVKRIRIEEAKGNNE